MPATATSGSMPNTSAAVSAASAFITLKWPPSGTTTRPPPPPEGDSVGARPATIVDVGQREAGASSISAASSSSRPYGSSMLVTPRLLCERVEQRRLGPEVGLHRLVQIEMIAAEVGEHGDVERHARHAVQGERVRRDLHHHRLDAVGDVAGEQTLQVGRLGCRADAGQRALHPRLDARRRAGSRR